MLILTASLTAVKKLKTQINLIFSIKDKDLSDDDDLRITQFVKTPGYLVFNGEPLTFAVTEAMKDKKVGIDTKGRSPSQRLRGSIYQQWEASPTEMEWEDFYSKTMDKIITKVKSYKYD